MNSLRSLALRGRGTGASAHSPPRARSSSPSPPLPLRAKLHRLSYELLFICYKVLCFFFSGMKLLDSVMSMTLCLAF